MKNTIPILIIVFLLFGITVIHYEARAACRPDHKEGEKAKEGPYEQYPKGSSTSPKVFKPHHPDARGIQGGPFIHEDGSLYTPPESGPVVSEDVMDRIRSTPRVSVTTTPPPKKSSFTGVAVAGDPVVVTGEQSVEDCCKKADKEFFDCYITEAHKVYDDCMSDAIGEAGGTRDKAAHFLSPAGVDLRDVYDGQCTSQMLQYRLGCQEACVQKCGGRVGASVCKCATPWVNLDVSGGAGPPPGADRPMDPRQIPR